MKRYLIPIFLLAGCILVSSAFASGSSWQYQFPANGATMVNPTTSIILRSADSLESKLVNSSLIVVEGTRSGRHTGKVTLASDRRTITFKAATPFLYSEWVTVSIKGVRSVHNMMLDSLGFRFKIALELPKHVAAIESSTDPVTASPVFEPVMLAAASKEGDRTLSTSLTGNDSLPRNFIITGRSDNPSSGKIFLANFAASFAVTPPPGYLMILNNDGSPVFSHLLKAHAFDFKVQPNGLLTYYDSQSGLFYGLDSNYEVVDSFKANDGYSTDPHELRVLPNGNFLTISFDTQRVDMSQMVTAGNPDARVVGAVIQEQDKDRNVLFLWRSWDHFKVTDATHENLLDATIDYVHANAIEVTSDGNILLSSRHLDEITKIDRTTGAILWRMGGKNNQFTFTNDTLGFSHQHCIRELPNGHYTLFDNGNFHVPMFSRALEISVDEPKKEVTKVWEYRKDTNLYSAAMGSVERLPDGNTLIGWGIKGTPAVTEVRPDNSVALEFSLKPTNVSYRAFRFPWPDKANAGVKPAAAGGVTLSQNYPNPFNPSTTIAFHLVQAGETTLDVLDPMGRVAGTLLNAKLEAGDHSVTFVANGLESGIYFYRLRSGSVIKIQKMVLVK